MVRILEKSLIISSARPTFGAVSKLGTCITTDNGFLLENVGNRILFWRDRRYWENSGPLSTIQESRSLRPKSKLA